MTKVVYLPGTVPSARRSAEIKARKTDHLVKVVAKAIYDTHRYVPVPVWDRASPEIRAWVTAQAIAAVEAMYAGRAVIVRRRYRPRQASQ